MGADWTAVLITGAVALSGLFAWVGVITFNHGRLVERVAQMHDRLEKGDAAFKEIREEQTAMGKVLTELTAIKKVELQRLRWIEQTVATWEAWRQRGIARRAAAIQA